MLFMPFMVKSAVPASAPGTVLRATSGLEARVPSYFRKATRMADSSGLKR